jgi:hypothetical protein
LSRSNNNALRRVEPLVRSGRDEAGRSATRVPNPVFGFTNISLHLS